VLGLALAGKERLERWPRFALEDVHRFAGVLAGVFVGIHVLAIAIDSYVPFSLAALVAPFAASYRPLFTALGVVAAELLLAIAISTRLRLRISRRLWRRLHYLNFAVWTGATLHRLGSGTDRGTPWLVAIYIWVTGAVLLLLARRLSRPHGAVRAPSA
jgi:sulfoxide reductase heme-binding subunit YedZ